MLDYISEESLHLAAQCWCDEETSSIEMDVRLAKAFAKRLEKLKLEKEFIKAYLDPKYTSFRTMINNFNALTQDQKDKVINLTKSLAVFNNPEPGEK